MPRGAEGNPVGREIRTARWSGGRDEKSEGLRWGVVVAVLALLAMWIFRPHWAWCREGPEADIEVSGGLGLPATINGGPGASSQARIEAKAAVKTDWLTVKLSARRDAYAWSGLGRLPFGNGRDAPWETLNRLGLGLVHSGDIGDGWGYFASADAAVSYEREIDGALGCTATAGAVYGPTPEWTFRFGGGFLWHAIRSYPFPVAGLTYRPNEVKGFEAELGFPYSHLAYRFSEMVEGRLAGEVDYGLYRLSNKSVVRRKGYAEFWGYSLGLWVDLTPFEALRLSLGGGWDFAGTINLYREGGEGEKSYSRSGAPRLGARLRLDF